MAKAERLYSVRTLEKETGLSRGRIVHFRKRGILVPHGRRGAFTAYTEADAFRARVFVALLEKGADFEILAALVSQYLDAPGEPDLFAKWQDEGATISPFSKEWFLGLPNGFAVVTVEAFSKEDGALEIGAKIERNDKVGLRRFFVAKDYQFLEILSQIAQQQESTREYVSASLTLSEEFPLLRRSLEEARAKLADEKPDLSDIDRLLSEIQDRTWAVVRKLKQATKQPLSLLLASTPEKETAGPDVAASVTGQKKKRRVATLRSSLNTGDGTATRTFFPSAGSGASKKGKPPLRRKGPTKPGKARSHEEAPLPLAAAPRR